ncbi:MAG: flagellar protein FlaG [Kiloniellaceae bacterium]
MDTTLGNSGPVTATQSTVQAQAKAAPVETKAAAPENVEAPQAVPATGAVPKPALKQAAPNSGLTTYKDHDTGRLIVRVFDRESGDVLVEFPPERAFRSASEVLDKAVEKAKKTIEV